MRHSSCRTTLDIYTRAVDQQKREANLKVVDIDAAAGGAKTSAPFCTLGGVAGKILASQAYVNKGFIGGPDRDRTDDLFHAMEAIKPQNTDGTVLMNRHNRQKRPNGRYLRAKCGQNLNQVANRLIVWNQPDFFFRASSKSSVSAKQTEGFGVLPPGMSGFLFGLESLDRFFGSLIGVHHGEAFVSEVPLKLGSNSELSSLR